MLFSALASAAAVPRGQAGPSGAPLAPEREAPVERRVLEHKVFLLAGQANVAGRGNAAHLTAEDANRLTAVRNRVSLTYWGGLSAFGLMGQLARRVHRAPLGPTKEPRPNTLVSTSGSRVLCSQALELQPHRAPNLPS